MPPSSPGRRGSNAIRPIETTRVHDRFVKSFQYLLTDLHQFDILQSGSACPRCAATSASAAPSATACSWPRASRSTPPTPPPKAPHRADPLRRPPLLFELRRRSASLARRSGAVTDALLPLPACGERVGVR